MSRFLRRLRPDFLTRISNIVIIQVVFVFAAVGLIFFYPDQGSQREIDYDALKAQLTRVGTRLAEAHNPSVKPDDNDALANVIEETFGSDKKLSHLEWYVADDEGHFTNIINADRQPTEPTTDAKLAQMSQPSLQNEISHLIHAGPLQSSRDNGSNILIPFITPDGSTACYYQYNQAPGSVASLIAIYDDDLFVTSRSTLAYALLLIFLTATLISLLIAYLLIKRHRNPMRRLIRGFEKTAKGELYQLVEPEGDGQLKRLSKSFNTMSETLWTNQQQMRDINERLQRTNKTLEDSRRFLRTMIDSSPTSVIAVGKDGHVTLCNRKATEDTGYSSEQMITMGIDSFFSRPLRKRLADDEKHGAQGFEAICVREDGSQFPAFLIASPIETEVGANHGYLILMKDITDSKSFQEMMIRIDRFCTRGEMAGDIAHEINNYLTILSGNIELMPLLLKKNNMERIETKLVLMRETIDKIARFCDGLMDANQGAAHFEAADLNQLIQNVVAFLEPQNRFDFVDVDLVLAKDLPPVEFDIGQIQQVLVNTIYNAAEALVDIEAEKKVTITTQIVAQETGSIARVSIHDSGPGVAPDKVELLFNKRFTTKPRGHGIGLITCKRILDTHHGAISYVYQNGARFVFEMPVVQAKSETLPANNTAARADQITSQV